MGKHASAKPARPASALDAKHQSKQLNDNPRPSAPLLGFHGELAEAGYQWG